MKRISTISIAISVLLLTIIGCGGSSRQFTPPAEFKPGLESLEAFDFAAADSVFSALSRFDSTATWGLYGLGRSEQTKMNYWQAAEQYYRALKQDSEFAPAMIGLGQICAELKWPAQAIKMLEKGIAIGGNFDGAGELLALQQLEFYEFDQAIDAAEQVANSGSFGAWTRAAAERGQTDLSSAASAVKEARGKDGSQYDFMAAVRYFELAGEVDSAAYYNRKMAESANWKASAVLDFFRQSLNHGDFLAARQAIAKLPATEACAGLKAKMYIDYHLARSEGVEAFLYNRGYQKYQERTLDGLVTNFIVKVNLADAFTGERMLVEIESLLESGKYPSGLVRLARLYTIDLHPEIRTAVQAVSRLEKQRLPVAGDYPFDRLELYIALTAGDFDRYDQLEEAFLDNYGETPANLTRLADLTGREAAFAAKRAMEFYPLVLEKSGRFMPAFKGWTELLLRSRRFDEAVAAFESYPHFAEQSPSLAAAYAICLAETNQGDKALEIFKPAMAQLTVRTDLVDRFLRGLWKFDRSDLGRLVCNEYISLASDRPEALSLMAEWLCEYGQYDRALKLAIKAEEMPLATRSARIQKARAMYLLGDKQKATNLFVELLDDSNSDPELSLYYSRLLAMDKKNPRQAGNLARSAMVKSRHTLRAFLNLSYVYTRQERYDLAFGQARQAIRQFPDHPKPFYLMGLTAYHENKDEYKGALTQAIALGLAGDALREAEEMLGK